MDFPGKLRIRNGISGLLLCLLAPPAFGFDHSYQDWDSVLHTRVEETGYGSRVDYRTLKKDSSALDRGLTALEAVTTQEFGKFTRDEKFAFLINAYNALTVRLILDHYPVHSIKDIGNLFRTPWKLKFFKLFGEEHSLDDIEHQMIRPVFADPRVHFTLVCASKGCPQLRKEAYVNAKLGAQLDDAARKFLSDRLLNRFEPENGLLLLSPIFKWYKEDFQAKTGGVEGFIAPFLAKDPAEEARIRSGKLTLKYSDYDWTLNDTAVF